MSREQLQHLIQLLDLAIASFEYKGERQLKKSSSNLCRWTCFGLSSNFYICNNGNNIDDFSEKSIVGTDNARTDMLNRTKEKNSIPSTHGRLSLFHIFNFLFFIL